MLCGHGLALIITAVLYNPQEGYYDLNCYNLISFPPLSPRLLHHLTNLWMCLLSVPIWGVWMCCNKIILIRSQFPSLAGTFVVINSRRDRPNAHGRYGSNTLWVLQLKTLCCFYMQETQLERKETFAEILKRSVTDKSCMVDVLLW